MSDKRGRIIKYDDRRRSYNVYHRTVNSTVKLLITGLPDSSTHMEFQQILQLIERSQSFIMLFATFSSVVRFLNPSFPEVFPKPFTFN